MNIQFIINYPSKVQDIPGRVSGAKCDLVFIATDIPPLGLSKFNVKENGKLSSTLSRALAERVASVAGNLGVSITIHYGDTPNFTTPQVQNLLRV